jgi:hypothetical protein
MGYLKASSPGVFDDREASTSPIESDELQPRKYPDHIFPIPWRRDETQSTCARGHRLLCPMD